MTMHIDTNNTFDPLVLGVPCKLWLKADSINGYEGQRVSFWQDQSSYANSVVQFYFPQRPSYHLGVFKTNPSVRFDGNQFLVTSSNFGFSGSSGTSIFSVIKNFGGPDPSSGNLNKSIPMFIRGDYPTPIGYAQNSMAGITRGGSGNESTTFNTTTMYVSGDTAPPAIYSTVTSLSTKNTSSSANGIYVKPSGSTNITSPAYFSSSGTCGFPGASMALSRGLYVHGGGSYSGVVPGSGSPGALPEMDDFLLQLQDIPSPPSNPILDWSHNYSGVRNWQLTTNSYKFAVNTSNEEGPSFVLGQSTPNPVCNILGVIQNSSGVQVYRNGINQTKVYYDAPASGTPAQLYLGVDINSVPKSFLSGDVAEILVFDGVLTDSDRNMVEAYLDNKYNGRGDNPPMYIEGVLPNNHSSHLNMYTKGSLANSVSNSITMTTNGTSFTNSAGKVAGSLPLYIKQTQSSFGTLNLYVSGGSNLSSLAGELNLFVNGLNHNAYSSATLFLQNNGSGLNRMIPLYVQGYGFSPGFSSVNQSLNLYTVGSGWNGLYSSPLQCDSTIPMFMSGDIAFTYTSSNIANMFLKTVEANLITSTSTLYMSGGLPTSITNQTTLVIPKTGVQSTTPLYIHGF